MNIVTFSLLCVLVFYTGTAPGLENDNSKGDIAKVSVWAIGEFTQGGYIKPGLYASSMNKEFTPFGELEGGWRFTRHFTVGMNLRGSLTENTALATDVYLVSFVFGWRAKFSSSLPYVADLKIGTIDLENQNKSRLFLEPSINFIKKALVVGGKKVKWSLGMSYRHVENESAAILAGDSLDSIGMNLNVVLGNY